MKNDEKILRCSNMMEISNIIMSDVFYNYCIKFSQNYRPFNMAKETQESWYICLQTAYAKEMRIERNVLFNLIPEKFHKTRMYNKLNLEINKGV